MRIYIIDQLIEKRVDSTGSTRQKVMSDIMKLLGCSRQKLHSMRSATKASGYTLQFGDAQKLKKFFGLEKIDDLLNPAADRAYNKRYGKKEAA